MNKHLTIVSLSIAFFWAGNARAQEVKELTINQATTLALQNHPQLAVSAKAIEISKQNTEVAKLQQLPSITAATSQFYLGNSLIIDKDFSNSMTGMGAAMPIILRRNGGIKFGIR